MSAKPIMIRPLQLARKKIDEAVIKLREQGIRTNAAAFCLEASLEKAEKILKGK